jgi:hypothetical protein
LQSVQGHHLPWQTLTDLFGDYVHYYRFNNTNSIRLYINLNYFRIMNQQAVILAPLYLGQRRI